MAAKVTVEEVEVKEIEAYFGRNDKGEIKGRWKFYRTCYNNESNLTVLCHACNTDKLANAPKEWFKEHVGDWFEEAIDSKGGLHQGVIFSKVFTLPENVAVIEVGGRECVLADGLGLGTFVNGLRSSEERQAIQAEIERLTSDRSPKKRRMESLTPNVEVGDTSSSRELLFSDESQGQLAASSIEHSQVQLDADVPENEEKQSGSSTPSLGGA